MGSEYGNCKACGIDLYKAGDVLCYSDKGWICKSCNTKAVSKYIAEQEAERAKVPTLEEQVSQLIAAYRDSLPPFDRPNCGLSELSSMVVAKVREHDFHAKWPNVGPLEFLREQNEALKTLKDSSVKTIHELRGELARAEVWRAKLEVALKGAASEKKDAIEACNEWRDRFNKVRASLAEIRRIAGQ